MRIVLAVLLLSWLPSSVVAGVDTDYIEGRDAYNRGDLIAALRSLRVAATDGSVDAQAMLAYILDQAEENTEAFRWYTHAAKAGNAEAQAGLAAMYAKGEGTEKDYSLARRWFVSAAKQGNITAISVLLAAYQDGSMETPVDQSQAEYWRKALLDARAASQSPVAEEL